MTACLIKVTVCGQVPNFQGLCHVFSLLPGTMSRKHSLLKPQFSQTVRWALSSGPKWSGWWTGQLSPHLGINHWEQMLTLLVACKWPLQQPEPSPQLSSAVVRHGEGSGPVSPGGRLWFVEAKRQDGLQGKERVTFSHAYVMMRS